MQDLYLRFDNEAQAQDVLYTKVVTEWDYTDPENPVPVEWFYRPNFANIDTIGTIYQEQDIPDPENPPEPIPYDGWFVNVRVVSENPEPLMQYSIDPEPYPMRVWG